MHRRLDHSCDVDVRRLVQYACLQVMPLTRMVVIILVAVIIMVAVILILLLILMLLVILIVIATVLLPGMDQAHQSLPRHPAPIAGQSS